ncbi:MAG: hypothetical protein JSR93_03695 [Verrucomicrobia bacterium]|nr:hypothetical protein [Verrucomicrobiota bacterium]
MSAESSSSSSQQSSLTIYQHLLRLHDCNDLSLQEESLNALPESLRQKIFDIIGGVSGQSSEADYGKMHAFDSQPALQKAVHIVALDSLQSLDQSQRNLVDRNVRRQAYLSNRIESNWQDHQAAENVPYLLRALDDTLGDLTPELQKIINDWVIAAEPGEDRERARRSINEFLTNKNTTQLVLVQAGLKTLPSIFDRHPFTSRLQYLHLAKQNLTSIPPEFGQLRNLRWLYLMQNQIGSIPPEIGQLQNLEHLVLSSNRLTHLPSEIRQLQKLRDLDIRRNYTLQGLPNELLALPRNCTVNIGETGLSERVLLNLREACNADNYEGPRISFGMDHMEHQHNGELKSLETLIAELFSVLGEDAKDFPKLDALSDEQKGTIRSWLSRLSDTADYKRKGEFQKAFVNQIVGYLQQANDNDSFRDKFLMIIDGAAKTCGDRVALSILHVGIAARLCQIKELQPLSQFLVQTVWPVQMLEEIARKKTETLNFFDEIEVYLGYPIMLRERLGLKIDVQEMLYFRCSALTDTDLNTAAEHVEKQQQDEEAVCAFLSEQEDWRAALRAQYPDRCGEIEEENYEELEAAGEDQGKIDQLETNRQQRWKALTAWALVNASHKEQDLTHCSPSSN